MNTGRLLALKKPECQLITGILYGRPLNWVDHYAKTLENYVKLNEDSLCMDPLILRLSAKNHFRTTHSWVLHIVLQSGQSDCRSEEEYHATNRPSGRQQPQRLVPFKKGDWPENSQIPLAYHPVPDIA